MEDVEDVVAQEAAAKEMDALDVLLGAEAATQHETVVIMKREGLPADLHLDIRSLTDKEYKTLSDEAEKPVNRAGRRAGNVETDGSLFLRLVVAAGTDHPNFNSPKVTGHHGVTFGHQVVQKILLPGEITKVAQMIMDISGFSENSVEYAGE